MKSFSKEIINIDGNDYTLFLNREGIVAWEKITKMQEKAKIYEDKYKNIISDEKEIEIKDGDNPFEITDSSVISDLEEDEKKMLEIYVKLYWIMLYQEHKLDLKDVEVLFEKATQEYGVEQLIELALQMVDDANTNQLEKQELKNLPALKPKKNK